MSVPVDIIEQIIKIRSSTIEIPEEVSQVNAVSPPANMTEALAMLRTLMGFFSAADATEMPIDLQAQCLQVFEHFDAVETVARASILLAFTSAGGHCEDADVSPRTWLVNKCHVTRGAAGGYVAWSRRAPAHPRVAAAMATGDISESVARTVCDWTEKLPEDSRDKADKILVDAVRDGLDLPDLNGLFGEMYEKSRQGAPDEDQGLAFEDRSVRLDTTIGGAGVITGDLSPECAAVVTTVLDALSAPADADDTRSHQQRYHDALEDAMRRLVAAGILPERAGQPAKVWAHISLADLIVMDADSALQKEWISRVRGEWAAGRARASAGGSDGAAWLEGAAAEGFACDASTTPVVTGDVNVAALDDLVRLCVKLAGHGPGRCGERIDSDGHENGEDGTSPTERGREALEQAIIGKAVDLLSGPGGLASFLRRHQLGAKLGGPSLPLDIGVSKDIPAGIRNAVRLRDQHCRWAGGCTQPASACEIHHIKHKSRGGKTSLTGCVLLCWYHHHVAVHRMGWTLVLNPDGTTTAWNRDMTKVLHSHGPPALAG
jgi:hypothetical protein